MKVIAVLNQKGGCGKTTIATHLASALHLNGADVVLVDSDPQGSARDWRAVNPDNQLPVVGIDRPTIEKDIKKIAAEWVVIDGAARAYDLAVSALKAANLILIPVTPSPYDVWATAELVELVKTRQEVTDYKLKAAFVISKMMKTAKISQEVAQALKGYELPVLQASTTSRVIYPNSADVGKTVFELEPQGAAAKEISALMLEAVALLND